jgi:hypothetical protein
MVPDAFVHLTGIGHPQRQTRRNPRLDPRRSHDRVPRQRHPAVWKAPPPWNATSARGTTSPNARL